MPVLLKVEKFHGSIFLNPEFSILIKELPSLIKRVPFDIPLRLEKKEQMKSIWI
jgi:hypothetical protein